MTIELNETHGATLKSWIASANADGCDFPIQNLPFAVFRRRGTREPYRGGVAIGDQIVDLRALSDAALLSDTAADAARAGADTTLNALMALGTAHWSALRLALSRALREGSSAQASLQACLVAQADAEYTVPARIGDYTDFYTSVYHATNVGRQFRPDNPLLPNYKWVPIGYHGRASTIGISGESFVRPRGQIKLPDATEPILSPCRKLDYELELGIYIGTPNRQGVPIAIQDAEAHVFGVSLFNDWSARDLQAWEYQPLGPFLSKNFCSTISPWIVTLEALAPYRVAFERPAGDPSPLPYLDSETNRAAGGFDIQMEVWLETAAMRDAGTTAAPLAKSSFKHSYWTIAQLVTHHTINGCALQSGDMFGSGTQSGPSADEAGSLLELAAGGKQPVVLANGETRAFLEDGDTVIFRGACSKPGAARIGFGDCRGTVLAAA